MDRKGHVVIAGGGVGGLAAAIGLQRTGWQVTVVERAVQRGGTGAYLGVQSNAVLALRTLGADASVVAAGLPVERYELLSWTGRLLAAWSTGEVARQLGAPSVTVPRRVLHEALTAALPAGVSQVSGAVEGYTEHDGGVRVQVHTGHRLDADLLVGADGLRSVVRGRLLGAAPPPRYAGYTAWRGVAAVGLDPDGATAHHYLGAGRTFGCWPLPAARTYWVATCVGPEPAGSVETAAPRAVADLRARYGTADPLVGRLLERTDPESVLHTAIYDRDPISRWHSDRVVLLGDAAHPMQPTTGQGAGQALLDALALVHALAGVAPGRPDAMPAALRAYTARRQPATAGMVAESRQIGGMHHTTNPVGWRIRNLVLRATPGRVWQRRAAGRLEETELLADAGLTQSEAGA